MSLSGDKNRLKHIRRPYPFIGFEGVGSRIAISETPSLVTITESVGSQLHVLAMTAVIGPGLTILWYFQQEHFKKHPTFILVGFTFAIIVGWYAFIKYLVRGLGRQRIEFRKIDQSLHLISWKGKTERILRAQDLRNITINESLARTARAQFPNFTLTYQNPEGEPLDLVTSDRAEIIQRIKTIISAQIESSVR